MSRKSRQGYSIRHLLQLPNAPRSPPSAPHPPAPCIKDRSPSVINEEEESFNATVDDSQSTSATIEDGQSTRATVQDGQSDLSIRPPTVRRRHNPIELVAAGETVKDALVTLKETMNRRQIHDDDECDLHGKVIAKKLRKLPEEERMQFVCEIYNMFLRYEQRTSFSPFSVASPSPSPTYQRAHTSHSSYSEPSMHHHLSQTGASPEPSTSHYQRAHTSHTIYSEPSMHHRLSPPVIHIPEQNPTHAASQIIITSNKCIRQATQEFTNNVENPIDAAFKYA